METKKRSVGRPKGTKNKEGVKTGRPKGSTGSYKADDEKRNINFNFFVSKNENEKILSFYKKEFKGMSKRKILLYLINFYETNK